MKRKILVLFELSLLLVACGQQEQTKRSTLSIEELKPKIINSEFNKIVDTSQISYLIEKGMILVKNFPDSAVTLYSEALDLSLKAGSQKGIAVALLNIGSSLLYYKRDFKLADSFARLALPHCKLVYKKNSNLLPKAYNLSAAIYFHKGEYDSAIYLYQKSLTLINKKKPLDTFLLIETYSNIGSVMGNLDQLEHALYYFKKIKNLIPSDNNLFINHAASNLMNIANYYNLRKKNDDSAILYYSSAIKLFQYNIDFQNKRKIQDIYLFLSEIWLKRNNFEKAKIYLDSSIRADEEGLQKRWQLLSHTGNLSFRVGDFKKATSFYKKSLKICNEQQIATGKLFNNKALAVTYDTIGQSHKAYRYLLAYSNLKDSIQNENKIKTVNQLEIQYRTSEKDRELAIKDRDIIKSQAQNQRKTGAILIASLCILLLLSILIFLRRTQTSKLRSLRQQKELDLLKATIEGEETERLRVGQELHDGVSGMLSAIKMNLVTLRLKRKDIADDRNFVTTIELADEAADELRKTAHNLVPSSLINNGITKAIRGFCDRVNTSLDIRIDVHESGSPLRPEPAKELAIYRIIQELIHNMIKHSNATEGMVSFSWQDKLLLITVEDNGIGITATGQDEGIGLENVKKRMKALSGLIEIKHVKDEGTSIYLEFPLGNGKTV